MELKLEKLKEFEGRKGPLLFIIMDGVGIGKRDESDAVFLAKTPTLDKLMNMPLYTTLKAHGKAVGLPTDDDMGNSEVGHNAIGAGRIFEQGAKLVNASIESGAIFKSDIWNKIVTQSKNGGTVHFIGLLSDGNVHSHINQLFALINQCSTENVKKVRVHILADGRDVGEKTVLNYITPLEELLAKINSEKSFDYRIASGGGRMITTMDRYEADWSIVERGWKAHVLGEGRKFKSATEAINSFYSEDEKITDQYLNSFVIVDENDLPVGTIEDGDAVIFFNFRGDRAIEISKAFEQTDFDKFDRKRFPKVVYAGMMQYDGDTQIPKNFLVSPPAIERTMSEYLCNSNVTSFAISETQKFGHVTYFWNGNRSGYINESLEKYIEVPSDKIEFDKAPKMKAYEVTEEAIKLLRSGKYKFGRINFANGDMVGHSGIVKAAIEAVETVDECLAKILPLIDELDGIALITADHGNADEMFTIKNGVKSVKTSHSLNPVPFIIYDPNYSGEYKMADLKTRGLTNIAGTLLNLLGFKNVEDYDPSLIEFL
ncbi:MAG: 2,3-bisphosphoglycerate-independent phosphoglycerate mutase [Ignavibacteriales bacterium CG_4_9_14_3_um_filter_34_10]|nr:MAG: 2,3-bisphosphoglycerate-independent phosphoglycerate mutase [Ignavibacteriales bacterium CG_4_9_14_3_um_filter_34_10]